MTPRTQAELWAMIVEVGQESWRERGRAKRLDQRRRPLELERFSGLEPANDNRGGDDGSG